MTTDPDSNEDWKVQLDANKGLGDNAFRSGDYPTAIHHYTAALSLDPSHATLLSNRSAAYLKNGEKSKALHDAQKIGDRMGLKGTSRLAAALQALGRWDKALAEWERILKQDGQHKAALEGQKVCQAAVKAAQEEEKAKEQEEPEKTEDDLLDDFFDDVEEVAAETKKQQLAADEPVATEAIRNHKKDLGTAESQIDRLLAENYKWRNLNPFFVLDIPHTASTDDISRRYKALSLLLHPDKNRGKDTDRVQEAYDQVLKAKAKLADEDKARHVRQLVEEGVKQATEDWEKEGAKDRKKLKDMQDKAVQKIFAQVEYNRRQLEERTRNQEKRERDQEEEEIQKERNTRDFDTKWKQEERVDKRIGNWRDFAKKKKKKT